MVTGSNSCPQSSTLPVVEPGHKTWLPRPHSQTELIEVTRRINTVPGVLTPPRDSLPPRQRRQPFGMFGEFAIEEFSRSSSFGAKKLIGGDTLFGPNHVPPLEAAGWKELAGLRRPRLPGLEDSPEVRAQTAAAASADEEADGAKVRETAVIAQIEACNRSRNYDESIRLSHQLHVMRKEHLQFRSALKFKAFYNKGEYASRSRPALPSVSYSPRKRLATPRWLPTMRSRSSGSHPLPMMTP